MNDSYYNQNVSGTDGYYILHDMISMMRKLNLINMFAAGAITKHTDLNINQWTVNKDIEVERTIGSISEHAPVLV